MKRSKDRSHLRTWALAVLITGGVWQAQAPAAPPVIHAVNDDDGNFLRFDFNVYDQVFLRSGAVRHVYPEWSKDYGRPADFRDATKILVRLYGTTDTDTRLGIPLTAVDKIVYWEETALERIEALADVGKVREAKKLLSKLSEFNPGWKPKRRATLQTELAKLASQSEDDAKRARGLSELAELVQGNKYAAGVEEAFTSTYLGMAEKSLEKKDYQAANGYINKVLEEYPISKPAAEFRKKLRGDAMKLVKRGEALVNAGQAKEGIELAAEGRRIAPWDATVRKTHEEYLRLYQVLQIACYEDAGAFDPFNATRTLEKQIGRLIFDGLFDADEAGREFFKSAIVKRFTPQALGTQYSFDLNQHILFSDGSMLTALDVANSVKLLKNPAPEAFDPEWAGFVQGVQVINPFSLIISIRQHPRPPDLFTFPIISSKLAAIPRRGQTTSRQPVGTGPFQVISIQGGARDIKLQANRRFRGADRGQPYIKEINFHRYTKKGTGVAVNDLERGQLHVITDVSPLQLMRLQSAAHQFSSRPFLSDSVWVLAINHRNPKCGFLQNREVRRAIRLAIDRKKIVKQYFTQGALGVSHQVVTGPFPPQSSAYNTRVRMDSPDHQLARDLLNRHPDAKQKVLSLKYPAGDMIIELAVQQIRKDLEAVGFQVHTEFKLPNDLIDEVAIQHQFELAYWRIDHNNILFNIAPLFDIRAQALDIGGSNFMGYEDQLLSQLFADLRREQIADRIWKIQRDIHQHLHTKVVFVPLWWLESSVVHTKRLAGRTPEGKPTDLPMSRRHLFRDTETWYLEPKK